VVVGDTLRNVRKKKIWDRTIGTGITGEKVKKMQLYNKVTIHSYTSVQFKKLLNMKYNKKNKLQY
jgi:hypothetical protein